MGNYRCSIGASIAIVATTRLPIELSTRIGIAMQSREEIDGQWHPKIQLRGKTPPRQRLTTLFCVGVNLQIVVLSSASTSCAIVRFIDSWFAWLDCKTPRM